MVYSMRSGCGSAGQSPVSMILRYQLSFLSMSFPIFTFMLFTLLSVSQVLANPPVITLELPSPANATNTSTTLQNFNWTVIDNVSSTITCNLTINGQTNASYNISNNTATNHSLSLANGVYVWYVICNNSVGNVGSSEIRNLTIDTLGPVITGIAVNQTDNFYSNASSNNILTLLVNATDVGPSGLYYVTANFSSANQSTTALINMTQIGNGQYAATINITNVTGMEFATANITTMAYDYAANPSNASGYVVILYNMTTPPAATCMQWGGSTTDFSTVTDFSDVSLVLDVQLNLSCLMPEVNASLLPAWFSQYTTMALINFASVDLSTQAKAMKLTNLSNNIVVNITAPGQFGDSRIYLNTSYFAELNITASVSLYHLPFSSRPNVTADVGAAGINSSLTWVQGIGEGNLTFIVNGFSGYNVTDLTAPIISLINPPNGSSIANNTPLINISINGTGTQLSHVLIVLSNSSGYTIQYSYNATNASNVTNTANCINVSQGSELFYCAFVPASLNDSAYMLNVTANDFGGNAPGNSKNMIFNFTVDTVAPAINSVTLNDTYISSGQSVFVSVNATDRFGVTNVTANGIGLNHTAGSDIWNGSIVLTGSSGSANITIVAVDASGNTNITYSLYTIDNTAPVIIVNSPANGSTISDVSGNLTLNYTVLEAQLVGSNVSIDYGTWTSSNTSNGTIIVQFTGIDAGNHTITITAYDNASLSNSTTIWFVMSAPVNVTQKLADMQMAVGNTTLLNVSLLDATNNSIDYSNNESLIVTNLSLALWMRINISETANVTVFIPIFSGSSTNWNATNFGIETNISSSIGTNVIHNTGTSVTSMVVFLNMSRFIPNSDYTNGTIIVFHQPLADLYVLYISDDAGTLVYKLNSCSGGTPPTTVTNATMCYLNTSSNVTVYIP
ncbi:MAG: hypothetical protein QW112_02640, partial [Candidatus Micrarchaeia archaeon]